MTTEIIHLAGRGDEALSDLWIQAAARWMESVERRRGSSRSREEYRKSLSVFFDFVGNKKPWEVTGSDCQAWAASMQTAGLANTTVRTRLAAVSSFYGFACRKFEAAPGQYLHNFNPATVVTRPHVNPYEHSQGLTADQVKALLKTFDRSTVAGARDLALVVFYLYTGRRCVEIARLRWADLRQIDGGDWEYHYVGKGAKTAWRDVPGPVWTALEQYLKLAGRWGNMQPNDPLFVSVSNRGKNDNQPLSAPSVRRMLDRASKQAGLGHVKVHGLRHTAAQLRRKTGATLEEVSKFLDHSSLAVTQVYLGALEAKKDEGWKKVEDLLEGL